MIRLLVKKELLPSLKTDQCFIEAIQLSRILCAIRYNKVIYAMLVEKGDMDVYLQLYLVINHGAVLYEGIKTFKGLEKSLKDLESYKKNIEQIGDIKKKEESFIDEVLRKIRVKVAFHFDKQVITRELVDFINDCIHENEDMRFVTGNTEQIKDMRFTLVDNLNLRFIVGLIKGEGLSYEDKSKLLAKRLIELSTSFCFILEQIISEMVKDYCQLVEQK